MDLEKDGETRKMKKKRTTLDSLFTDLSSETENLLPKKMQNNLDLQKTSKRPNVKQQTVYIPLDAYEQLRRLAFEERKKMHDYILAGLDRVFEERGLPSISELQQRGK